MYHALVHLKKKLLMFRLKATEAPSIVEMEKQALIKQRNLKNLVKSRPGVIMLFWASLGIQKSVWNFLKTSPMWIPLKCLFSNFANRWRFINFLPEVDYF